MGIAATYYPKAMENARENCIVATLGPTSLGLVPALLQAGASAFRLNASHLSAGELAHHAGAVRREFAQCPLVIDLRGAKMRLGCFAERTVSTGARVRFSPGGSGDALPLPHREIFSSVAAGDTLGCDDDRLHFRVISAAADTIEAVSLSDGILRPRKGINVLDHPIILEDLNPDDLECIRSTVGLGGISYAFSFMKDGREAEWIRRRAPGCRVIGKIERREATLCALEIACRVDEVWICRGDLGAQLGSAAMARWIAEYDPRSVPCPVLMAGQVLEHLTQHGSPTRAEVCHLFDLVSRGYAGFVLSDETAIGTDPAGAVRQLRSLLTDFATQPPAKPKTSVNP